jgi:hypothetical protein
MSRVGTNVRSRSWLRDEGPKRKAYQLFLGLREFLLGLCQFGLVCLLIGLVRLDVGSFGLGGRRCVTGTHGSGWRKHESRDRKPTVLIKCGQRPKSVAIEPPGDAEDGVDAWLRNKSWPILFTSPPSKNVGRCRFVMGVSAGNLSRFNPSLA